jgi:hypothetical protein
VGPVVEGWDLLMLPAEQNIHYQEG